MNSSWVKEMKTRNTGCQLTTMESMPGLVLADVNSELDFRSILFLEFCLILSDFLYLKNGRILSIIRYGL